MVEYDDDEDEDDYCGFAVVVVSASYVRDGQWHYCKEPWIGPLRKPGPPGKKPEKAKKWAARYGQAARRFYDIQDIEAVKVISLVEWDHWSNPYREIPLKDREAQVGDQVLCIEPADDLTHGELYDVVNIRANRLTVQLVPTNNKHDKRKTSILLTHLRERFVVRPIQSTP